MITIKSSGVGRCVWCCQNKDGVVAEFEDGLKGHLCWGDFRKAVKVREPNPPTKKGEASPRS